MRDALARTNLRQDGSFFGLQLFRNKQPDAFANDLLGGIAEHSRRGVVPGQNDSIQIFAD